MTIEEAAQKIAGGDLAEGKLKSKVQDAYSMRSTPQVIGAAHIETADKLYGMFDVGLPSGFRCQFFHVTLEEGLEPLIESSER